VFPGGHRIRPSLTVAVARACGDRDPQAADAAAAAIEMLHCASLVHDDLPCFDNAGLRRGKASVHVEFGEPLAVLVGDALIVLAFETIARGATRHLSRMVSLMSIAAASVGAPRGIVAGQAWECEPSAPLSEYQRAKTGALFIGAAQAGAVACGADPAPWRALGDRIGEAYQVADDLRDVLCDAEELGKPVGQDAARLRPNAAAQLGVGGAKARLTELVEGAVSAIPPCPGQDELRMLIKAQTMAFFPKQLAAVAA
jgi:geranylgeranyl diphosphate synthase type II